MRSTILAVALLIATVIGCEGPIGPAGVRGPQGEPGGGESGEVVGGVFSGEFNETGDSRVWIPRSWTEDPHEVFAQLIVESPGTHYNGDPVDLIVTTGTNNYVHIIAVGSTPELGVFVAITGYVEQRWWLSVVIIRGT